MGRRNLILRAGSLVALIATASLIYFTPHSTLLLMALIFVIGAGGSAMTVCFGSVRELNDVNYSSTSLGLMNMCIVGAGAVMQPLIGWLLDSNWDGTMQAGARLYSASNYSTAFFSLLVVNLAALIGALLLRETHCQQIPAAQ